MPKMPSFDEIDISATEWCLVRCENCTRLALMRSVESTGYQCECRTEEDDVAHKTQSTPDDTTTQAVEP